MVDGEPTPAGEMTAIGPETIRIVRELIGLEFHRDAMHGYRRLRAHPAIFGIANLLLCGYFDNLIKNERGEHNLTIFIGISALICGIFFLGYFHRQAKEVLEKTSALPIPGASRVLYAWYAIASKPLFVALYSTDLLFFVVLFRTDTAIMWPALALLFLFILDIQMILTMIMIKGGRSSSAGYIMALIALVFAATVLSAVFHFDILSSGRSVIGWVTVGIYSAKWGETKTVVTIIEGMALTAVLAFFVGVRRVR